eukprot:TRINITY_DN203_c0_g1_i11.p1 TRINITY_DN203_c0_g1~~TRINITY_DN203_c0_g1_i11.p1  ORF type:complete len:214 (-),score=60.23 TRINITY_DN203_c0_g1_i11:3-644(-)
MVQHKDQEVKTNAVKLVVALSSQVGEVTIKETMTQFPTGKIPSWFIIKALADIAYYNPAAMVEQLNHVFEKVVPVLGAVKKPVMKSVITTALGRFAGAMIQSCSDNKEEEFGDEELGADEKTAATLTTEAMLKKYGNSVATAFDVVFTNWRKAKEPKLRLAVAEACGLMTEVMAPKKFKTRYAEILDAYCSMYKKKKYRLRGRSSETAKAHRG